MSRAGSPDGILIGIIYLFCGDAPAGEYRCLSMEISTDFFKFCLNLTILFLFPKEKVYKKKSDKERRERTPLSL